MQFFNASIVLLFISAIAQSQDLMLMQLWFHAVMEMSSNDPLIDEKQRNQSIPIRAPPDWGKQERIWIDFIKRSEEE